MSDSDILVQSEPVMVYSSPVMCEAESKTQQLFVEIEGNTMKNYVFWPF